MCRFSFFSRRLIIASRFGYTGKTIEYLLHSAFSATNYVIICLIDTGLSVKLSKSLSTRIHFLFPIPVPFDVCFALFLATFSSINLALLIVQFLFPFAVFVCIALLWISSFPSRHSSLGTSGSRPLFPQWSHHVYPQFLPGGHPAHRHPHTHCKLECEQHVNNNTHAHSRIASYHRAHAGNAAVDDKGGCINN